MNHTVVLDKSTRVELFLRAGTQLRNPEIIASLRAAGAPLSVLNEDAPEPVRSDLHEHMIADANRTVDRLLAGQQETIWRLERAIEVLGEMEPMLMEIADVKLLGMFARLCHVIGSDGPEIHAEQARDRIEHPERFA